MTEKLYDKDSFLKEFTATVLESCKKADGYFTVLDKTAFFPEGGGQPSDIGHLDDAKVYDVQIDGGVIYHYTTKPFFKGQTVRGRVDFERRFDFMQQHSAEHIVSGIAHSLYGCENVGFHLSEATVTLDFDKYLTEDKLLQIEAEANRRVYENAVFNCYYPSGEALKALDYRSKKELEGAVRIVEIENTDVCACCAPHVKNAGQIGIIKLLDCEKLRGGIRIKLKAGSRALADYNEKYGNVQKISSALAVMQNEAAVGVERLSDENRELKFEISSLKKRLIAEKTKSFVPDSEKTAVFEEGLDIKELQLFADALYKKSGGIRGVFSGEEGNYSFAICGEEAVLDLFFKEFKEKLNVRGGGRNGMVQGTVAAVKDAIEGLF